MSQRNSGYARQPDDIYETPAWVTQVIMPYLVERRRIWDPANGPASKVAHALRQNGFTAVATADDFMTKTSVPADVDTIVTNPPYGTGGHLACKFIAHALELVPVVFMLLRIDFDSGKTRTDLFRDCRAFAGKVVLLDRIVWFAREGAPGPSENHAWYIWNRHQHGLPTIEYVGKHRERELAQAAE
jgi:hypothetical protein